MRLLESALLFYKLANNKKTMRETLDHLEKKYQEELEKALGGSLFKRLAFIGQWGSEKYFAKDKTIMLDKIVNDLFAQMGAPSYYNLMFPLEEIVSGYIHFVPDALYLVEEIRNLATSEYLEKYPIRAEDYKDIRKEMNRARHIDEALFKLARQKMLQKLLEEMKGEETEDIFDDPFFKDWKVLWNADESLRPLLTGLAKRRSTSFYIRAMGIVGALVDQLKTVNKKIEDQKTLSLMDVALWMYNRLGYNTESDQLKQIFNKTDLQGQNYMRGFLYFSNLPRDMGTYYTYLGQAFILTEDLMLMDMDYKTYPLPNKVVAIRLSGIADDNPIKSKWQEIFNEFGIIPL